ncbi:prepilin peptidase [Pseudoroseicyclus sp. CXY001]|uniref:prepilin peptidase n=1 Tax=Pseudoroseicyclus sp. CXY001 TaxID=3242492 RepID=UPI00358DA2FD
MLAVTMREAAIFLPLVVPICLYVCWSDLRDMKITNRAVLALLAVFVVLGPVALDLPDYLWRYSHLAVVLAIGILLNAVGAMGAGDAKFAAAAAPFIALADLRLILLLFAACLLASFVAHRVARATPLRRLAPDWESWESGRRFPMGLPLSATLVFYLALGLIGD